MKPIKRTILLSIFLVAIFSFAKFKKNKNLTSNINLEKVDVIAQLSKLESGCRPSNEVMFYVETEIIKKYRGFSEINAKIYVLDRISGVSTEISSGYIVIPYHKDTVIDNHIKTENSSWIELQNGDKIIKENNKASYSFNKLIKYTTVYNNYIKSTNKLLSITRV